MTEFNKAYYDLIDNRKNINYMKKAIHNSNISKGGPFGCIIVKNIIKKHSSNIIIKYV